MGKKKSKSKMQVFVNKYYMPLLLFFVFGILLTAAILDKSKKFEANSTTDPIILEQGWSYNEKTDSSIKIYGSEILSTEPNSDDVYHEYYCQTDICLFIHGNDNYALIDDGKYMVFSLIDEAVFDIPKLYDLDESEFVVNNNVLYGLIFNADEHEIYYSLEDEKYFFENNDYYVDRASNVTIRDRHLLIFNGNGYYLYDLGTKGTLLEEKNIDVRVFNKDYYYIVYDGNNNINSVYTSDLYKIDLTSATKVSVTSNDIIYTTDNQTFIVKNKQDEVVTISSSYDEIYDFVDNYVLARIDDTLLIINHNDEVLKEIPLNGYFYDNYRSGYYETDNKEGFHLFLDNNIDMQEVYFNPNTLEYYVIKH